MYICMYSCYQQYVLFKGKKSPIGSERTDSTSISMQLFTFLTYQDISMPDILRPDLALFTRTYPLHYIAYQFRAP